jgi:tripartite-type tricarboxylate transporter receptor subunit TctC
MNEGGLFAGMRPLAVRLQALAEARHLGLNGRSWVDPEATMPRRTRISTACFTLVCLSPSALIGATGAQAQDKVAAFYRGKTVQAIVGYTPGSTFELYLRFFIQHLPKHIPGNPAVVIQHMPGAGSLKATGYLAAVAPKDGLTIGMPNPVNTIEPLIDPKNSRFDPRQFAWLGSLNSEIATCGSWAKDIKTIEDLKRRQFVLGATGPAAGSAVDAKVVSSLLGYNFKIVTGYPGLTEVRLAANRGEVDGYCGLQVSSLKTDVRDQYKSGQMSVVMQTALQKHPELPNVPNAYDLVKKEEDRQLFKLIFGPWAYGRPLMAPPGTPPDRVNALRGAVKATLADPQFRAEANKINLEIQPTEPEAISKLVAEIFNTPESVLEQARGLLGVANR